MRLTLLFVFALALAAPLFATAPAPTANPLLGEWTTPYGVPPFAAIKAEHFLPAFKEAIRQHDAEVVAIVKNPEAPTFANTLAALDDSGELLSRTYNAFGVLSSAETNEALQAVEAEIKQLLAAHADDVALNPALFARVKAVWDDRAAHTLSAEEAMLLGKTYRRFVRGGATLEPAQQERLRAVNAELSQLTVRFSSNLLEETNTYRLVVKDKARLAGLGDDQLAAAAEVAAADGVENAWAFTLKASSIWPFLHSASDRGLREELLTAYTTRCRHGNATDNRAVYAKVASLRVEKAQLLGYRTWANFILDEYMAKNPETVYDFLGKLWQPAQAKARAEAADLQAMIDAEGGDFKLAPWDWRYYSEKVKKAKYDLDEDAVRAYLPYPAVRDGAFTLAGKLYGLSFTPVADVPVWHADVQVYQVKEKDGKHLGLYYLDPYPRPGKRGGAWCSSVVDAWVKQGTVVSPVIYNVLNAARPVGDTPTLMTADEAETLFHEFGHALHFLLVTSRFRGSSANVAQDFVELPSQVMENWVFEPEMLALFARHWKTGEAMPAELVAKIKKVGTFNQGFANTEYLAASLLDMDWHTLTDTELRDVDVFEQASLAKWGLIAEIPPRYRTTYFLHSADEYSAGYYSYTWSAVLDADAFQAFKDAGNLFDPATAKAFRALLEAGGGEDPAVLYRRFRGRDPQVDALLVKRGLK